jgi:hypothetical protein
MLDRFDDPAVAGVAPDPLERISSAPDWLIVPAYTTELGSFSTGIDLPVIRAWSTNEWPLITVPSIGIRPPG